MEIPVAKSEESLFLQSLVFRLACLLQQLAGDGIEVFLVLPYLMGIRFFGILRQEPAVTIVVCLCVAYSQIVVTLTLGIALHEGSLFLPGKHLAGEVEFVGLTSD